MPKKPVLRSCVICREKKEKKELIRIVRSANGEIILDKSGKISGRGAYLCNSIACINTAKKTKKLEHALEVEIPNSIYDALLEQTCDE